MFSTIIGWVAIVSAVICVLSVIGLAIAIKNEDAAQKSKAMLPLALGVPVFCLSGLVWLICWLVADPARINTALMIIGGIAAVLVVITFIFYFAMKVLERKGNANCQVVGGFFVMMREVVKPVAVIWVVLFLISMFV